MWAGAADTAVFSSILQVKVWICGQLTLSPFLCHKFLPYHPVAQIEGQRPWYRPKSTWKAALPLVTPFPLFCGCLCVILALWSPSRVVSERSESQYQCPSRQAEAAAAIFGLLHGECYICEQGSIPWLFLVLYHLWGPTTEYLSLILCNETEGKKCFGGKVEAKEDSVTICSIGSNHLCRSVRYSEWLFTWQW